MYIGKKSDNPQSEDYVPSIFSHTKRKSDQCLKRDDRHIKRSRLFVADVSEETPPNMEISLSPPIKEAETGNYIYIYIYKYLKYYFRISLNFQVSLCNISISA